jgi:Tol biopolymer transport system component
MSPDGKRLAVKILSDAGDDIWITELDQGPLSRLTFHGERELRPGWTPDGRSVTFVSDRAGQQDVYVKRADGTGPAELLLDLDVPIWEASWSPDGTWLIVRVGGAAEAQRDILGIRPGTDSVPVQLAATEFQETAPTLSPDGRWLAYASDETGQQEVYVRPFPETEGGKWQVSTDGGRSPLWAHSGRELFYLNGAGEMVAAQVVTEPSFSGTRSIRTT